MSLVVLLALAVLPLASAAPGPPKQYKCSVVNEDGFCFVENVLLDVTVNGGLDPTVQFPQHPTVLIKSGSIPYFGKDIFALLGGTRQLHVYNNTCIKRLFIPATNLTEINVQRNGLAELDVEATENRELRMLSIVHNAIVSVPRNIRFLIGLEKLYLYNNSIEYLDLELLANASGSLKILSIYDNRIKTLDSRAGLQFPKIQTLSLSKNKMSFVPYFVESFPALTVVSLRKNPWNCHWLRTVMGHIEARKIQVVRKDGTCRDRWVSEICCTHSLTDYLFDWHAEQLEREQKTVRNLSTENQRLLETVNRLSGDVLKLQAQFQQLQPQQNTSSTSGTVAP
ncbi:AGAP006327-PA-like protein [Anopheles sinensis]|uniref:AGAP006327-PA-like protein n=1 Tax=Anopheles sinensis TaxID=74873 RepID=A0A084WKB3_ANOSI|nr:AGAP006327-PA-like protein [Anopheles sinensis]